MRWNQLTAKTGEFRAIIDETIEITPGFDILRLTCSTDNDSRFIVEVRFLSGSTLVESLGSTVWRE